MSHSTQVKDIVTLKVLQPITISATLRKKSEKICQRSKIQKSSTLAVSLLS